MKIRYSKLIVAGILTATVCFTAAVLYLFFKTGSEPTALIAAWFAFATGELGALAGLRHSENKHGTKKEGE